MASELVAYQARESWMGTEYLTLMDLLPENPRAVIVGLNPAPASVTAGYYYQGRVGQRQLRRLADVGLLDIERGERRFEEAALAAGVGFTDLVKRPTVGENDVTAEEIAYGRALLEGKLSELKAPLVICVFRHAVKALLGHEGRPGLQPSVASWGGHVFRMPGPFDAVGKADAVMEELRELLRQL